MQFQPFLPSLEKQRKLVPCPRSLFNHKFNRNHDFKTIYRLHNNQYYSKCKVLFLQSLNKNKIDKHIVLEHILLQNLAGIPYPLRLQTLHHHHLHHPHHHFLFPRLHHHRHHQGTVCRRQFSHYLFAPPKKQHQI